MMHAYRFALRAALLLTLAAPAAAGAQAFQDTLRFEYAVKAVCGRMVQPPMGDPPAAVGSYYTVINVHNPGQRGTIFRFKRAYTLPNEAPGPISPFVVRELGPDRALRIDCNRIRQPPAPAPTDAYVVIQSAVDLDVVAVYTAAPPPGGAPQGVSTLDIERVQPRRMMIPWCVGCPAPAPGGVRDERVAPDSAALRPPGQ